MSEPTARDEQVLTLRQEGRSFAKIARLLGLKNAREIINAYSRAASSRTPGERAALCDAELRRLDALTTKVRGNAELTADEITHRVATIDKLRAILA